MKIASATYVMPLQGMIVRLVTVCDCFVSNTHVFIHDDIANNILFWQFLKCWSFSVNAKSGDLTVKHVILMHAGGQNERGRNELLLKLHQHHLWLQLVPLQYRGLLLLLGPSLPRLYRDSHPHQPSALVLMLLLDRLNFLYAISLVK